MIRYNTFNKFPSISKTAYIDSTATIIGNVKILGNVFVGPEVVIRADEPNSLIIIRQNCNIQDRVVIHALENSSVLIDKNTSLAHGSIVHGPAKIGKYCFIGFGAVVFKSELKDNVMVKHLAVVEGVVIEKNRLVLSGMVVDTQKKADGLNFITKPLQEFCKKVVSVNLKLKEGYLKQVNKNI